MSGKGSKSGGVKKKGSPLVRETPAGKWPLQTAREGEGRRHGIVQLRYRT